MSEDALKITDLTASYAEAKALHGVSLTVRHGEVVALLGRNGAGRTTILRSIMGLVDQRSGSIVVNGQETIDWASHKIARSGVGFCPEERGIFGSLSCEENLDLLPRAYGAETVTTFAEIYRLFPNLYERRNSPGMRLSGGEQQMLAIARILRTGAKLLLLDEISEGLAPVIVQSLAHLVKELKRQGFTILLVEQNFRFAAPLADRFYIVEHGKIAEEMHSSEVSKRGDMLKSYLSV
ncbi:ABC transporter ATP-binding protein [Ensifer sp. ENS04]|uniref:ABC transporter ATP-binding protein n=1 Tax=Ensifer sp. ENS04 TaxID=2769281 RepID=UPI001784D315|nr:ABC transporter ATP-binding protein [Ensifer sp. ENS04]MBD9541486.1 ABC transporter ATP-binding protein [Ensifer sp. ENS04]